MYADERGLRYQRIAEDIRRKIRDGIYEAGGQLPPQRKLAESYDVAPNTIRQALDLLIRDGYVVSRHGTGTYVRGPHGLRGKVLIVDDDEAVRRMAASHLQSEGWEVQTAETGAEALQLVRQSSFDLLVTDLVMPELDGAELIVRMRVLGIDVPTVVVTAYPDSGLLAHAMNSGPVTLLRKPFTRAELLSVAKDHARRDVAA